MGNEELEKAIIILWSIWRHKNLVQQNESSPDSNNIIRIIERNLKLEENAKHSYQSNMNQSPPKSLTSRATWNPPLENVWKLNVDASWNENQCCGGVGWILCDSSRSSICMGYKKINITHIHWTFWKKMYVSKFRSPTLQPNTS